MFYETFKEQITVSEVHHSFINVSENDWLKSAQRWHAGKWGTNCIMPLG